MKHIKSCNRLVIFIASISGMFSCTYKSLVCFFCLSSMLPFSENVFAADPPGIALENIRFFESGDEIPAKKDRNYLTLFLPESRYINIELNVTNLKHTIADQEYPITFIWRYFNGDEFGKLEGTFTVKADWQSAYINRGWGFKNTGNWRPGRFTAQVFVNNQLFAEEDFYISPYDKEFISLPEVNDPVPELQNLPAGITYKIVHQYKIEPDPYLNYFYGIDFSRDGEELAFCISHYEFTSSSAGSTTTRDMYLFRNNRQIIPNYFTLRYHFDKDLKNLAFFGLKLTTANIADANGYGYYNGYLIYTGGICRPLSISPDHKKYTYVLNSMPSLKSSFTWDNAYEYVMINNQKVQPEGLKIAKSIQITESSDGMENYERGIVYVRNPDGTYNAVYTVKYKFDDQTSFALFNETERMSQQFDGYISKPYLSPDETKVACIVQDKKEWFVIINNERVTKGYKEIKHESLFKSRNDEVIFCSSSGAVVYQAKVGSSWYVMKGDEMISEGFSEIEAVTLGPDEKSIAYKAKSGGKWSVYVNKKKISGDFDEIGDELVFSPDATSVAYAAANGKLMFVMADNRKLSPDFKIVYKASGSIGKSPLAIQQLTFNATADKVAYVLIYEYSGEDMFNTIEHSCLMINDSKVSPMMYNTRLHSNKAGELFYAGFTIEDKVLQHIRIDF